MRVRRRLRGEASRGCPLLRFHAQPFEEQAKSARERFAASSSTASRATGAKLATVRKRKPLAGRASPSSPTGAAGRTEVRRRGHLVFYSDGWIEDFDEAAALAKKEGKDLLVDFTGSDW